MVSRTTGTLLLLLLLCCVLLCSPVRPSKPLRLASEISYDHRPEYCGLAPNTDSSPYFVPFYILALYGMAPPINLAGKWKLTRSENFDEYLKEMDLSYLARTIANQITPVHEVEQDGDSFVIKISTPRGTQVMTFKVGEEFEQKVMSYQGEFVCKAIWEGNQLVIEYTPKDKSKKSIKETREIVNDEYVLTIYIGNVVCKRIFKRKA